MDLYIFKIRYGLLLRLSGYSNSRLCYVDAHWRWITAGHVAGPLVVLPTQTKSLYGMSLCVVTAQGDFDSCTSQT